MRIDGATRPSLGAASRGRRTALLLTLLLVCTLLAVAPPTRAADGVTGSCLDASALPCSASAGQTFGEVTLGASGNDDQASVAAVLRHVVGDVTIGPLATGVTADSGAVAGTDPCVPAPADRAYLALVPREATVRLTEPGATVTVVVEGAADRDTASWSISAVDLTGRQEGRAYLDVALDRQTIAAGAPATLTLTLRRARPSGPIVVALVSSAAGQSQLWPLAVVTR